MEEKLYRIQTTECFYEDDWEDGEVGGTFTIISMGTSTSKDPSRDIAEFVENFSEDGKVYVDDDFVHTDSMMMPNVDGYGWRKPTEEEIEKWKAGKINLYNVEYQLRVWEMTPIDNKNGLKGFVKDLLKE
jgi:hypothetical protein